MNYISFAMSLVALFIVGYPAALSAQQSCLVADSLNKDGGWALVNVPVACMRTHKGHSSELASQAVMGTPVRLLQNDGDWWRVMTPEGYEGWVIDNSLCHKSDAEMSLWREASRWVVTSFDQIYAYSWPGAKSPRQRISDLENGSIVTGINIPEMGYVKVELSDGRSGYVAAADVSPIGEWASQKFDASKILDLAYSMEGSPYLWGGTSTKSVDCSGLSKIAYYYNGIILMRDAGQQAQTGRRIEAADSVSLKSGDLLFFGNPDTQKVTHVAIYDDNGHYVHSSGRVKRNCLYAGHPLYLPNHFLWAVRICDSIGSSGITRVSSHPWYFNQSTR